MIDNSTIADVHQLHLEGMKDYEIAKALGITSTEVYKARIANGHKMRKTQFVSGDGHLEDCELSLHDHDRARYEQLRDYYRKHGMMCSSHHKGQGGFDVCRALSLESCQAGSSRTAENAV